MSRKMPGTFDSGAAGAVVGAGAAGLGAAGSGFAATCFVSEGFRSSCVLDGAGGEALFIKMYSDPDRMRHVMETVGAALYERLKGG